MMTKIARFFQQIRNRLHAETVVAQLNTGAHIVVHGRLRVSAVVIDCYGRQHSLDGYISQMADESL